MNHGASYTGHNLVFIVGAPRSGTTWLQRLLASHPQVRTGQESKLFVSYLGPQLRAWHRELTRESDTRAASGRGGVGLSCYFEEENFLPILRNYMLQLLEPMIRGLAPGELFLEKTPSHALYIPEIKELLPESRIIHIRRDARDVVASLLVASRGWGAGWAPKLPKNAASTWVRHVKAVQRAARNLSAREFLEITYEQLWAAPEVTLKGVASFLDLAWSDEEIRAAVRANQPDAIKSGNGTPIPLRGEAAKRNGAAVNDPATFVRKAQPGAWKTDLSLQEKLRVWQVARKMMREVGYSWH